MLYYLLPELRDFNFVFNVFGYLTFRSAAALVTGLVVALLLGRPTIDRLRRMKVGQVVREEGPQTHLVKSGTPTMGGVLIVLAATISALLWAQLANPYTLIVLVVFLWMGALGFLDDYLKVVRRKTDGLVARYKLVGQLIVGVGLGVFLVMVQISPIEATVTSLPFFDEWQLAFKAPMYVAFVAFIIIGTSNAVNLTDGLDGLAAGLVAIFMATFAVFAYVIGRVDTSAYLGLFYLPGAGELAVFAAGVVGACLGFLWFNCHPAEVFMGDTGSLALGGAVGAMAVLLKTEFLLAIVGGVFVMETVSVIVQTSWFRYTKKKYGVGRRVFLMAPIHHHFEKAGWPETRVVVRFWILGILFAMIGLSTLKLR